MSHRAIVEKLRADIAVIDSLENCVASLVLAGGVVVDDAAFASMRAPAPACTGRGWPPSASTPHG